MDNKGVKKPSGVQLDIYGKPAHALDSEGVYRMVKCGKCGETVKSSNTKLHLSFGRSLNLCKRCLEDIDSQKRMPRYGARDLPRVERAIESYGIDLVRI